jgi:RNA polymerase sigma-70 factor (ECF subfamily)
MEPKPSEGSYSELEPSCENVGELLEQFRPRLQRMLTLRLHPRLRRRVDPADVLQETYADVVRRLDEYRTARTLPFFLWVRFLALQKVAQLHRHHLGKARRDAAREVTPAALPAASTVSLARAFVHPGPAPSEVVSRREILARVREALERLEEVDREVLALRYFERLSVEETALALGLSESGVLKRQLRALAHMQGELPRPEDVPTPP